MKRTNTLLSACGTVEYLFIFRNDISETGDKYKNKKVRQFGFKVQAQQIFTIKK